MMPAHKSAERLFLARFDRASKLQRARLVERHYRGYSRTVHARRLIGWDIARMARDPLATMRDRFRVRARLNARLREIERHNALTDILAFRAHWDALHQDIEAILTAIAIPRSIREPGRG